MLKRNSLKPFILKTIIIQNTCESQTIQIDKKIEIGSETYYYLQIKLNCWCPNNFEISTSSVFLNSSQFIY